MQLHSCGPRPGPCYTFLLVASGAILSAPFDGKSGSPMEISGAREVVLSLNGVGRQAFV